MYKSKLNILETEIAIKEIKDFFEKELAKELNLTRVSAPLFVKPESGLNDNLNGIERPVNFDLKTGEQIEIVHSLAKWKRMALHRYGFKNGEGIYTDMNAIRRDEDQDAIHSIYVDQWDWEKILLKEERNKKMLREIVNKIFMTFKKTELYINELYPQLRKKLPDKIFFITTQELEDRYPNLTPKEREHAIAREYKAIFLMEIGGALASGKPHDGRAADYDDWTLNGDIILYYEPLDIGLELSSMGIRVDEEVLEKQLLIRGEEHKKTMEFHSKLLNGELPYTIGGGIGQSRICMYFLEKLHIGEVQASVWTENVLKECKEKNIELL
jgi:aspartate--ammonia ligase